MTDSILPSLDGLLDQFEAIGGPEEYGPEGIAIMVALWRKAGQLGWKSEPVITQAELIRGTGIQSQDTILMYLEKLVSSGIISILSVHGTSTEYHINSNFT